MTIIGYLNDASEDAEITQWHYAPDRDILQKLESLIPSGVRVLEIGPGRIPFSRATHFIDHNPSLPNCTRLDLNTERLPFPDHYFDFVYCRHVLEDLQNPDFVFREIIRVSRACYIETPSPLVEMLRRIDGPKPLYRGYIHHRYFVWSQGNIMYFLPKYPLVEYLRIDPLLEAKMKWIANHQPLHWNHYFFRHSTSPDVPRAVVFRQDIDFDLFDISYGELIFRGVQECLMNNKMFHTNLFSLDRNPMEPNESDSNHALPSLCT